MIKLKINGLEWRVKFTHDKEELKEDLLGLCVFTQLKIYIADDADNAVVRTSILHELVHAYLFSYGFTKVKDSDDLMFSEEQICDFVAMNLISILDMANKLYDAYENCK